MKIIVLGTRGIPDIQGGVETHCQQLYPRLVKLGCDVTVYNRKPYVLDLTLQDFSGVRIENVFTFKLKSVEAIVHAFLGVLKAWRANPDILHVHAIGPSLMVPMAKLLGLKVVVTNHGPDYDRQKWGKLAKFMLKLGERFGAKFADRVIVISEVIQEILARKYNRKDTDLIYNGVTSPEISNEIDYIDSIGLEKSKYIIGVGRFVKEKGFHDLIEAFKGIDTDLKLVLVGDADHEDAYSSELKKSARHNNVVLSGFIKGRQLSQIFSHARLFVMPSYHEGLPIALLEAMSYNLDVLVSDIPANQKVPLCSDDYFKVGDVTDLQAKLAQKIQQKNKRNFQEIIRKNYDWEIIAKQTLKIYQELIETTR